MPRNISRQGVAPAHEATEALAGGARAGPKRTQLSHASEQAISFCERRGVGGVRQALVEELPFPDAFFDVITVLDVLEHTDDDLAALREVRRVAKPGALVISTVPAYGFLWSEHDEALQHRRRYSAHELRNKMTVSGMDVERSTYFVTLLFWPVFAVRIAQGLLKKSTSPKTAIHV